MMKANMSGTQIQSIETNCGPFDQQQQVKLTLFPDADTMKAIEDCVYGGKQLKIIAVDTETQVRRSAQISPDELQKLPEPKTTVKRVRKANVADSILSIASSPRDPGADVYAMMAKQRGQTRGEFKVDLHRANYGGSSRILSGLSEGLHPVFDDEYSRKVFENAYARSLGPVSNPCSEIVLPTVARQRHKGMLRNKIFIKDFEVSSETGNIQNITCDNETLYVPETGTTYNVSYIRGSQLWQVLELVRKGLVAVGFLNFNDGDRFFATRAFVGMRAKIGTMGEFLIEKNAGKQPSYMEDKENHYEDAMANFLLDPIASPLPDYPKSSPVQTAKCKEHNMAQVNTLLKLADKSFAKDLEQFGEMPVDVKQALQEQLAEESANRAKDAAKEILSLFKAASVTVENTVNEIRSYNNMIGASKKKLAAITRAKEFGNETQNYIPLAILTGQIYEGDVRRSNPDVEREVPDSWKPKVVEQIPSGGNS